MAKENKPKEPSVSIIQLFRFATVKERIMILVACVFSAGSGALQPISILMYGSLISNLTGSLSDLSNLLDATLPTILIMVYMGTASLVAAYISTCLWIMTGENQTRRIRSMYLHSVLKQDMAWFDSASEGSLNTRLASDTQLIQDGISEKFGLFISFLAQFIGGFIVAFIKGWQMALIMLAIIPLLGGTGAIMSRFLTKYTTQAQNSFAEAGSISEQAFQSIRTVYAFSLQKRFSKRYEKKIDEASRFGVRGGYALGVGFAFFMFFLFGTFGLALWFGSRLVSQGQLTGPSVFIIFLSMMIGCMSFVKLPPNISAIASARGAAYKIYLIIDRVPLIDIDSDQGLSPSTTETLGAIELKNVTFNYPTRPDLVILDGIHIKVEPGMTCAFVGPSGSGKSTVVQLLQRLYDVSSGDVRLDGHNVKDLNVKWLRQQIGVVSQEPVLFNMTIRENLHMGTHLKVSETDIIAACKEANCHKFISELPQGYETFVGEQGGMLSGGQKQRIAIARAILKNPSILLLDEATSALDTQSERLVQNALDKASSTRTTIVVAHRLSTIKNADLIVVLDHGKIIEQGTHGSLIQMNGTYADLVQKQAIETSKVSENEFATDTLLEQEKAEIQEKVRTQTLEKIDTTESNNESTRIMMNAALNEKSVDVYEKKLQEEKATKKFVRQQNAPTKRVLMHMKNEWKYLVWGICGAILAGCVFPLYAFSFSHIVSLLSLPNQEIQPSPLGGTNLYAFIFLILGIAAFIGNGSQFMAFEICGQKYSKRLRGQIFDAYLNQEIGFFDNEENNTGSLTGKLAVDARLVNEMITKVWGDCANMVVTIVCGLIIAFTQSWALTLITLCTFPFLMASTAYEFYLQRGFEDSTKRANAQSSQVAGEAIREVRTVTALNKQSYFEDRYYRATEHPHRLAMRKAYLSSIGSACSKSIGIYTNAIAFYAGIRLIQAGQIDFQKMFTSMTVIMTTAENAGRSTTFVATFSKAKIAAFACFEILDRVPTIDPTLEGYEPQVGSIAGDVKFEKIKFAYPARPELSVFDGKFNLEAHSGKTIALVGPSGCGKSTTVGLLQRWYDPLSGVIRLYEKDIRSYSVNNLRSHMALVGQEPTLFDMTIEENIRFGIEDHIQKNVSLKDIEQACAASNIHGFIQSLPDGYNTRVGDKGSQLSGGQKQRIAIARALVRKPKILLLDEATSALDSESERVVQKALDNILDEGGRTTIVIAHRLSTIKNADLICVVKGGQIVEKGTHWELLQLAGIYKAMTQQQSLDVALTESNSN